MASRIMGNRPKCHGPNTKEVFFKFFPNGTSNSALTIAGDRKLVSSVVRNATAGEYLVTMSDAYRNVTIFPTIQMASATDLKPQVATMSNENTSTALTFLVRALAVATPTDIAADANNAIHIHLVSNDSSAEEV